MAKASTAKKTLEIPGSLEEKKKALAATIAQIEKDYGAGAVMRLGGGSPVANVESIPTGSIYSHKRRGQGSAYRNGDSDFSQ